LNGLFVLFSVIGKTKGVVVTGLMVFFRKKYARTGYCSALPSFKRPCICPKTRSTTCLVCARPVFHWALTPV